MDLNNWMYGIFLFALVFIGLIYSYNSWYASAGVATTLDNSTGNTTYAVTYLSNWANQTQGDIQTSSQVPFIGGAFVMLTGVFQSVILLTSLPGVILVMFTSIAVFFGLPSWFVTIIGAFILVSGFVALMAALIGRRW